MAFSFAACGYDVIKPLLEHISYYITQDRKKEEIQHKRAQPGRAPLGHRTARGDLSKAVVYPGPRIYGPGRELVALTLSVAHDASGKAELVLHYQNNEVILSDGKDGKFHDQPQ